MTLCTQFPHVCRVQWNRAMHDWLTYILEHGDLWYSMPCRSDPDYEIYMFKHEHDMVRFQLTWM